MRRLAAAFTLALTPGAIGLVPKADAQPTPISACPFTANQEGSYELDRPLTSTGNCITITASKVTINLRGFSISGNGTSGIGIAAPETVQSITVQSMPMYGTVSGFEYGIRLLGSGSTVDAVQANGNTFGIFANGTVSHNYAMENRFAGIVTTGATVAAHPSSVTVNYVFGGAAAAQAAFGIIAGPGSSISYNIVSSNADTGIIVEEGSTAEHNNASNNGIGISVTCPSHVFFNTATANGQNLLLNGDGCNTFDNLAP